MPTCGLDCAEMTTDAPELPFDAPGRQDTGDENDGDSRMAWLAGLYHLHGPPGPPASVLPMCPAAPFVEPRTVPFPVRLSAQDLSSLLGGCVSSGPACPWQDVCEGGAYQGTEGGDAPECKWVVYAAEEDGAVKLQMHRSWTGTKLIELTIDTCTLGSPLEDMPLGHNRDCNTDDKGGQLGEDGGSRITHITFETHGDYKLKGADEGLYKSVAREVCWWGLGVCLGRETGS